MAYLYSLQCRRCQKICQAEYPKGMGTKGQTISKKCTACDDHTDHTVLDRSYALGGRDPWPRKRYKGQQVEVVIRKDPGYVRFHAFEADRCVVLSVAMRRLLDQQP